MKRLMFVVLAALLLTPTISSADTNAEIDPGAIGEGWALGSSGPKGGLVLPLARKLVYVGPSGSTIVLQSLDIGASLAQTYVLYGTVYRAWSEEAIDIASTPDGLPDVVDTEWIDAPDFVTDQMQVEGATANSGLPQGYGLYGSIDLRTIALIRVEGTVNGLTGVAATDYVAGLYFAALSGQ